MSNGVDEQTVSIPTLISKMSLANGLIYTYTKQKGTATTDSWCFTVINFHTVERVWEGTGRYRAQASMPSA